MASRKPIRPDARRELAAIGEEMLASTRGLCALLRDADGAGPAASSEMQAIADEIDGALARAPLAVLVLGEPAHRRALLDAVFGADVFSAGREVPGVIVRVRAAPHVDYVVTWRSGMTDRFGARIPDRSAAFAAALARASREADDEEDTLRALSSADGAGAAEIDRAHARRDGSLARLEQLQADCERYEDERGYAFQAELRELVDADARGSQVRELRVECPTPLVADAVELVDPALSASPDAVAGARAILRAVDGCVLVTDAGGETSLPVGQLLVELHPVAPRVVRGVEAARDLPRLLERIRGERPLVVGSRALSLARPCLAKASADAARAEAEGRRRVHALEALARERKSEQARAKQAARDAAEQARAALARAGRERLRVRLADLRIEWRAAAETCTSRSAVEACVEGIRRRSPERLAALAEEAAAAMTAEVPAVWAAARRAALASVTACRDAARRVSAAAAFDADEAAYAGASDAPRLRALVAPGGGALGGVSGGIFRGVAAARRDAATVLEAFVDGVGSELERQIDDCVAAFERAAAAALDDAASRANRALDSAHRAAAKVEWSALSEAAARAAKARELEATVRAHDARFAELAKLAARASKAASPQPAQPRHGGRRT